MCQVFNFINARKIHEEKNIFSGTQILYSKVNCSLGILNNSFFLVIVVGIFCLQILIGTFGNRPFNVSFYGMNIVHWLIAVGFGVFSIVWGLFLKLIPIDKMCPKVFILKYNKTNFFKGWKEND